MPALALVESRPFAYTRNPLYLSMTLADAGNETWRRAPVALALLTALLVVVRRGVIEREERYLVSQSHLFDSRMHLIDRHFSGPSLGSLSSGQMKKSG